jgi:hypothetical protein|tara:strand:+ start:221 stop:1402 length:1182 start_codon:yes stop_codon:yes gene_type:complete
MVRRISFNKLKTTDLHVDAVYCQGKDKNVRAEPISKLVGCGNSGGFRFLGSVIKNTVDLCVLYSSLDDPDWPDELIIEVGRFIYYGDNKSPGTGLHDTPRKGNLFLRQVFDALHTDERNKIPPILVFTKAGHNRDVQFRGLAVPGAPGMSSNDDLLAIWKIKEGARFQNYKAVFSVLNEPSLSRGWINDVKDGNPLSPRCPAKWREWVEAGSYDLLKADYVKGFRTKEEQLPADDGGKKILREVKNFFENHENGAFAFEECAARLFSMFEPSVSGYDMTRPRRDGGRDAIGIYSIGKDESSIKVDFALEAKCYGPSNGVNVKETSRLISRLRHRQFGVLVTTSYVGLQAYKEIVEDQHPVVVLCGKDVVELLRKSGITTVKSVKNWLQENFSG